MSLSVRAAIARVRAALEVDGLLLEADARLPSVTTTVAGAPVRGSWWSHPAGHAIFHALGTVVGAPDVLLARLVDGKVTLVLGRHGPALLSIAESGEAWQTRGLSAPARRLLDHVERAGEVRSDRLPASLRLPPKGVGDLVRDLERRLLVRADAVHTETGAHAKVVTTWARWARARRMRRSRVPVAEAKAAFERVGDAWAARTGVAVRWPWSEAPSRRRGRSG